MEEPKAGVREAIDILKAEAARDIAEAADAEALERVRIRYLGRKGALTELFRRLGEASPADRPSVGQAINELKSFVTAAFDAKAGAAPRPAQLARAFDATLPGITRPLGQNHPLTTTMREICDTFISLGFKVVDGPEIETEHYNFEALNIPLEHPSRDAFDTFYVKCPPGMKRLLRSHTSPVQARFMESHRPPFSIVIPGKVFRPDATDASHSFMFHQVEGLVVGGRVRFSDLKGVLTLFARQMFGEKTRMRFRPSFFPFTEPSAEVDISCFVCLGAQAGAVPASTGTKRCSLCGGRGWLEIGGAGMVNPKVFKNVGYDPEKVTGFAFGMGVERIAMLKYGIDDIRLFYENDIRFLKQFA